MRTPSLLLALSASLLPAPVASAQSEYGIEGIWTVSTRDAELRGSVSPDGKLPEIVERTDHPWFIGVQSHPELKSKPFAPAPLFRDFVRAAKDLERMV